MSYSLKELLDLSRLRQLLDCLDEFSCMPSAIFDTEGNIFAIDPNACLVASSGYSSDPTMASFGSYGFKGAVAKPCRLKEISQELSTLLLTSCINFEIRVPLSLTLSHKVRGCFSGFLKSII